MKTKLLITALSVFAIFISCNKPSEKSDLESLNSDMTELSDANVKKITDFEKQQIPVGKFLPLLTDTTVSPVQTITASNPDWDKKIIKTATLRLEIKDFKKYNDYVHIAVKQYGGYIAQEEQNLTDEKSETVISIKVPVVQFEALMNQLPGEEVKVLERKITTVDVTGEVVDTKSRLEAKKQMRLKYLEFLKQSKNMEEVLQVQHEINDIQEQIESAAGRISFLSHQSAYSTINLSFYQPVNGYQPTDGAPSFFTRVAAAFKTGTFWVADLIIGLISIWPLILILTGVYIGWRIIKPKKVVVQNA